MVSPQTRLLIVGDIHGCLEELHGLLEAVSFRPGHDRLVSVGDLVGKGPDGAGVVRFFRKGGHDAVRGNHEEKLLRWRREGGPLGATHREAAERLSRADWRWLEGLPLWLSLAEHEVLVVHAGLVPGRSLAEQRPEDLMTMRSILPDGSASPRVDEGVPWASLWPGPQRVVFGHDAIRRLQVHPHALGLDSGCVYGGSLTALLLPDDELVSVPAERVHTRPGKKEPLEVAAKIAAGRRAGLSADEVRVVALPSDALGRPREALVLLDEDDEPRAYLNRCEHLPIPLDGGSRRFFDDDRTHLRCGTHGAIFRRGDGLCLAGPCAGRSLLALPIYEDEAGELVLSLPAS